MRNSLELWIETRLVFLAFDDDRGPQLGDEGFGSIVENERVADPADRGHALQAQFLAQLRVAGKPVAQDPDYEIIAAFRGEAQQAQVAGVNDVEVAGDEYDALAGARLGADRTQRRLRLRMQF